MTITLTEQQLVELSNLLARLEPDTAYMPVPRCATCRFWTPMGLTDPGEVGRCDRLKALGDPAQPVARSVKYAWVEELAELRTSKDFGCVAWEVKKDQRLVGAGGR